MLMWGQYPDLAKHLTESVIFFYIYYSFFTRRISKLFGKSEKIL